MSSKKFLFVLLMLFAVSARAQTVSGGTDPYVVDRVLASVNDEIILESEVMQYVQDIVLRNRDQYQSDGQIAQLRSQILQELINQKILLAIAEDDTNVVVEPRQVDQQLDQRINEITRQLGSEEALEKYYGKPIRQIRREFRNQVRDNMLIEQLRTQKLTSVNVSRSEVEDFYNRNKPQLPPFPERYRLSHILISIQPEEEAVEQAREKADSLFNLLLTGAEFEQLAMENSDDRATGNKGGLLGTTQRGDLVPEYESVAFDLNEGEISEPIQSRFGFHIIRLNWRRGEKINTSHILISLRATDEDAKRAEDLAKALKQRVDNGDDFARLAEEFSDDEETASQGGDLGWFDKQQLRPEYARVVLALDSGQVSDPFRSQLGYQLIKLTGYEPSREMDLQSDWDRISKMAKLEKQEDVYNRWVESLRKDIYIEMY